MPPKSKIIKLGLESRVRELYNNELSLSMIADTLSNESGQKISKTTVHEYLKSDGRLKSELIEKKTELQTKIIEADISTIEDRQAVIEKLVQVFQVSKTSSEMCMLSREIREHLDSLDKRLGKLSSNQSVQINNINAMKLSDIPTEQLLRMVYDTA